MPLAKGAVGVSLPSCLIVLGFWAKGAKKPCWGSVRVGLRVLSKFNALPSPGRCHFGKAEKPALSHNFPKWQAREEGPRWRLRRQGGATSGGNYDTPVYHIYIVGIYEDTDIHIFWHTMWRRNTPQPIHTRQLTPASGGSHQGKCLNDAARISCKLKDRNLFGTFGVHKEHPPQPGGCGPRDSRRGWSWGRGQPGPGRHARPGALHHEGLHGVDVPGVVERREREGRPGRPGPEDGRGASLPPPPGADAQGHRLHKLGEVQVPHLCKKKVVQEV